jgi:hypothetical protein
MLYWLMMPRRKSPQDIAVIIMVTTTITIAAAVAALRQKGTVLDQTAQIVIYAMMDAPGILLMSQQYHTNLKIKQRKRVITFRAIKI